MDKLNPKGLLVVDIMDYNATTKMWTIRIHLDEDTSKIAKMTRWCVEAIEGDPGKRGWVTVDMLGQVGDRVSIVLPEPIHDMGTNISVLSKWIDTVKRPIEEILYEAMKEKEKN